MGDGKERSSVAPMKVELKLNPAARIDFDEAADWYAARGENLKVEFIEAVSGAFSRIVNSPLSFPIAYGSHVRKVQVKRFPYTIYYTIQSERILIYSVFHTSRNPIIWRGRID